MHSNFIFKGKKHCLRPINKKTTEKNENGKLTFITSKGKTLTTNVW